MNPYQFVSVFFAVNLILGSSVFAASNMKSTVREFVSSEDVLQEPTVVASTSKFSGSAQVKEVRAEGQTCVVETKYEDAEYYSIRIRNSDDSFNPIEASMFFVTSSGEVHFSREGYPNSYEKISITPNRVLLVGTGVYTLDVDFRKDKNGAIEYVKVHHGYRPLARFGLGLLRTVFGNDDDGYTLVCDFKK